MKLVLCQCSSSRRVGGLLACDCFMNFFPALCTPAAAAFAAPGPAPMAASLSHHPRSSLRCLQTHRTPSFLPVCLSTGGSPLERAVSAWPGESPAQRLAGPQSCPSSLLHAGQAGNAAEHPHRAVAAAPGISGLAFLCRTGLDSASLERLE